MDGSQGRRGVARAAGTRTGAAFDGARLSVRAVAMELDVYALGAAEDGLEAELARKLAARARSQKP